MRKSLILLAVLLFLSVTVLAAGHVAVDRMQDDIMITETTCAGDPAAAEGLTVALHTHLQNHLFWRTSYAAGTDPAPETGFTFSAFPVKEQRNGTEHAFLTLGATNSGRRGNDLDLTDTNWEPGFGAPDMLLPAADVAARTQAGETHTEVVSLQDYYQYYTVGLTCGSVRIDQEASQALSQYFKIPVPEGKQVEVSISKNQGGKIYEARMGPVGSISMDGSADASAAQAVEETSLYSDGIVTDQGIYLRLWTDSNAAEVFSEIAGGYGVYFIPFEEAEMGQPRLDAAQTQNIYALDPKTARPVKIVESQDKTRLLLFTLEQDQLILTVLDAETREPLQRLPLPTDQTPGVYQEGALVLLHVWNADHTQARFLLLCREDDGTYRLELDVPVYEFEGSDVYYNSPSFCYDGERLAVASFAQTCTVCLLIYDQTGLRYAGRYVHTADQIEPKMQTNWSDALVLRWES